MGMPFLLDYLLAKGKNCDLLFVSTVPEGRVELSVCLVACEERTAREQFPFLSFFQRHSLAEGIHRWF